jgi:hypothetical protein
LAVDQNFLKAYNTIIRTFNQLPKSVGCFLALDQNFLKAKIPLIKLLSN